MSKPAPTSHAIGNFSNIEDMGEHLEMSKVPTSHVKPSPAIDSLADELFHKPVADIARELSAFFDINVLLDIDPAQDPPETQARKKQVHQRWESLTQEQKHVAQERYQYQLEEKQRQRELDEQRQHEAAQASQESLVVPGGKHDGPIGPASGMSRKASTIQKLQHDRQTLSGPASAN